MKGKKVNLRSAVCEAKENIQNNGRQASTLTRSSPLKGDANQKIGSSMGPLSDITSFSKSPQEMRNMTRAQESLIYNEFSQSSRLHNEFYDLVEEKLGDSKISAKIRQIRNMTNEKAM